ncbi:Crp/Fnr family transcriptional regulator [Alkalicoccobacillus porphyridii]|uniref:Crp/Fnr family transcriptional regulator n=1 Tax=Alkalicoccobacillus porphyridii TaxID=2597270 RepID=UPI00163DDEC5|nr:Crp/Fnr family transcriptional regulator [Alkalicoccobacillus porphyridii]
MKEFKISQVKELFEKEGKKKVYSKKEFIYHSGEAPNHVYYIKEGWVKTSREIEAGKGMTFLLRKEKELFGVTESFAGFQVRERSARCMTKCTIYSLQVQTLQKLMDENQWLCIHMMTLLAQGLLDSRKTIENLINQPVTHRLAWFLTSLTDENKRIQLPISHEEISHLIGCSRQTVTELLNKWATTGLISYQRKQITLLQPDSFMEMV